MCSIWNILIVCHDLGLSRAKKIDPILPVVAFTIGRSSFRTTVSESDAVGTNQAKGLFG